MKVLLVAALVALANARPDFREYISKEGSSEEARSHSDGGTGSLTCACGWTNKARIVGGKETIVNEFPLQVALMEKSNKKLWCGGSIITENHVLTASHCTYSKKGEGLYVIAGGHNLYGDKEDRSVTVDVDYTVEHEKYDPRTLEYDIAIAVLVKPLKYTQYIGPVCLPSSPAKLLDEYVKVLGWGMIQNRKSSSSKAITSDVLLKVNLRVIPMEDCLESFPFQPLDLEDRRQICTFRREKDSCGGDSGGPLIWLDPDTSRYTQVALVSYGRSCGKRTPAVNTDVFYYMDWIKKTIADTKKSGQLCYKA